MVNLKDTTEGKWSVEEVVKKILDKKIVLDIAIQRSEVWKDSQKEALMDSILEGLPKIPYVEANRDTKSGVLEALDGKQRLSTLRDILGDVFVVTRDTPFKFNGKEYDLTGKRFSEFPQEIQQQISLYPISFIIYEDLTDIEKRVIFYRRNLGKPLSKAELFRATCNSLVKVNELGHHKLFDSFTNEAVKEDMVVKTKIMLDSQTPHIGNDAETAATWATISFNKAEEKRFVDLYNKTMEIYDLYKEISAERVAYLCNKEGIEEKKIASKQKTMAKKPLKKTHLLSFLPVVERNMECKNEIFALWLCKFFDNSLYVCSESSEYNAANNGGMGSVTQTKARLNAMLNSFSNFKKSPLTREQVINRRTSQGVIEEIKAVKEKATQKAMKEAENKPKAEKSKKETDSKETKKKKTAETEKIVKAETNTKSNDKSDKAEPKKKDENKKPVKKEESLPEAVKDPKEVTNEDKPQTSILKDKEETKKDVEQGSIQQK